MLHARRPWSPQEASRDGAPPIELASGLEPAELLKKYETGVRPALIPLI